MKYFGLGVLAALVAIGLAVYIGFATGSLPVATSAHPLPFEKQLATMDLEARAKKEMPKQIPIQAGEDNLLAGANVYTQHCASCHGLPDEPRPEIADGMFPPPPRLYQKDEGVTDDPPAETYWKIKNGIRLSGMPAFQKALSGIQLWQAALFLASTDNAAILQRIEEQRKGQGHGQSASTSGSNPAAIVSMSDDALTYMPSAITIHANQAVEWKNSSREAHTITADPHKATNPQDVQLATGTQPFDSGFLEPGQTYVHRFTEPGTYKYVCTLHEVQHMIGEVIVRP